VYGCEHCDIYKNVCVEEGSCDDPCTTDNECPETCRYCNPASNKCEQGDCDKPCITDSDCALGCNSCVNGTCVKISEECRKCNLTNLECPSSVITGNTFLVNYSFYGTGPTYGYEVRKATRGTDLLNCTYNLNAPACVWHNANFTVSCPFEPGDYTYSVTCYGVRNASAEYCGPSQPYDSLLSCKLNCFEVPSDVTLVYNVTVTEGAWVDGQSYCEPIIKKKVRGEWQQILPRMEHNGVDVGATPRLYNVNYGTSGVWLSNNLKLLGITNSEYEWHMRCWVQGNAGAAPSVWKFTLNCKNPSGCVFP